MRSDAALDRHLERMRAGPDAAGIELIAAAEGLELELKGPVELAPPPGFAAKQSVTSALAVMTGAACLRTPSLAARITKALIDEDVRPVFAVADEVAALVGRERPNLLVLEIDDGPSRARLDAVHALDPELPIIAVTAQAQSAGREIPGIADQLVEPFSSSYARARIRAALMRRACRWQPAEPASDEARRLATLHRLRLLDSPREERFDRLTRLAAALFDAPISLVTLIDSDRQWFKSTCGIDLRETPRDESFCAHAVASRSLLVVPDTLRDDRFADHPAVSGPPRIRFYAGHPLILSDEACVGTLCVADMRPRDLSPREQALLADLAQLAASELDGH